MPSRIAIVGCGLIGGSLLRSLRESHDADALLAIDPDEPTREAIAKEMGVETAGTIDDRIASCQVVVLAQPLPMLLASMEQVALFAADGAVVTDVAGIKGPVLERAERALPARLRFVGGHPMAGKERGGWRSSEPTLFADRRVALCRSETAHDEDVALVEALWRSAGAQAVRCSAAEHDEAVARVSHLPYLAAASVMRVAADGGELAQRLAAGGLRDTTRVAEDPTIRFVAEANDSLPGLARELASQLLQLADKLERGERPDELLDAGAEARRRFFPRAE